MCPTPENIAFFITPHGFGHAARACGVLGELRKRRPSLHVHLFTTVPEWFFSNSLGSGFTYHHLSCDVGLVQHGPLHEDLPGTIQALKKFIPYQPDDLEKLAESLRFLDCQMVLADISPLGITAGKRAGKPTVLVENFTWDWIYKGYPQEPAFEPFISELKGIFQTANVHFQTRPWCKEETAGAVRVNPVGRKPRHGRHITRRSLDVPDGKTLVLVTLGGIPRQVKAGDTLRQMKNCIFLIPGGSEREEHIDNLILLPHHHPYYHPDLMDAADVVMCKVGYSTLAEAYWSGAPILYLPRPGFPESPVLERFAEKNLESRKVSEAEFLSGNWIGSIQELAEKPRKTRHEVRGEEQIADVLLKLMP